MTDLSYVDDNNGYLCPFYDAYPVNAKTWPNYLYIYLDNKAMTERYPFICDTNSLKKQTTSARGYTNYAMNLNCRASSTNPFRKLITVKKTSNAVVFGDSSLRAGFLDGACANYWIYWSPSSIIAATSGTSLCFGHLIHSGGMNLGFLDGHVEHAPKNILQSKGESWFDLDD